ncbi:ferric-dicitrate binding protein FerR (iron transport regulator) [Flavobacterium nitrogenifigens]|uniref:Ferric-dicitrate binding protein FerR (Iron transport regulator) n=2 Tax=Flavobacterium TaxID=237 RepID=A0A7W7IW00_9FLAO|nr:MULTISPECIES: FecR domain-containing protein [Flavobacterium]MBB4801606.1 ferric-dicitrate binding protein FerR (iron transport regulator) [Flavobacterium nitrogenifigens]MBB6386564.1 ferric-dicitrate binding protein FerR (iron transport regulator) [Flavobacterium notoginsengisoli]
MKKEIFLQLAKKYEEGTCTPEEKIAVESFFDKMQEQSSDIELSDEKGDVILNKIFSELQVKPKKYTIRKALKIAAILVVGLSIAFSAAKFVFQPRKITQLTAKGEKKEIFLEDGSVIVLNSNSSVTYPEEFDKTRNIELVGQAYFKVFRDVKRPFIVQTHDVKVRVLGTSFDINSYNHHDTKVSVISGKVEVSSPTGKKVQITKNQQADLIQNSDFQISTENSDDKIAWISNTIMLKNTKLSETVKIIENWYNVSIDIEDQELNDLTISGKFKDEKLENVLESIAYLKQLKINYTTKNHITIRKKTP